MHKYGYALSLLTLARSPRFLYASSSVQQPPHIVNRREREQQRTRAKEAQTADVALPPLSNSRWSYSTSSRVYSTIPTPHNTQPCATCRCILYRGQPSSARPCGASTRSLSRHQTLSRSLSRTTLPQQRNSRRFVCIIMPVYTRCSRGLFQGLLVVVVILSIDKSSSNTHLAITHPQ